MEILSVRIIKKYPNRRLYDTTRGSYITLHEVKQLVLEHIDFKVIDERSKKDITKSTLLQIINEQEATSPIFTTRLLQDFIRAYHEKSQDLFSNYLQEAMELFKKQKDMLALQWKTYENFLLTPSVFEQALKLQKQLWNDINHTLEANKKEDKNTK